MAERCGPDPRDTDAPPLTLTPALLSQVAAIAEALGRWSAREERSPSPRLRRENRIHTIQAWLPIENTLQEAIRTQGTSATAGSEMSSEIGSEMPSPRELELLEMLSAQPRLSARELGERLGISQRAIEKHLAALQRQGRLRRQGSPRSGSWQVLPSGSGA
jgi:predicted HTH transcriptional regulator